jgi:hypothetical protein
MCECHVCVNDLAYIIMSETHIITLTIIILREAYKHEISYEISLLDVNVVDDTIMFSKLFMQMLPPKGNWHLTIYVSSSLCFFYTFSPL